MRALLQVAVVVYAVLFIIALWAKLDEWPQWKGNVDQWVRRRAAAAALRAGIPTLEFAVIVSLFVRPLFGVALAAATLFVFGVGALVLTRVSPGSECGCFGALMPTRIGIGLAIRNVALGGIMLIVFAVSMGVRLSVPAIEIAMASTISVLLVVASEGLRLRRYSRAPTSGEVL